MLTGSRNEPRSARGVTTWQRWLPDPGCLRCRHIGALLDRGAGISTATIYTRAIGKRLEQPGCLNAYAMLAPREAGLTDAVH
jgi:hypothetical protein